MRKEGEQGDYGWRGSVRRGVGSRGLPCGEVPVARGKAVRYPRERAEDRFEVFRVHGFALYSCQVHAVSVSRFSIASACACEGPPRNKPN